ncbi:Hydroxyethylthiazole kinase family-domain-containing protein [Apodospora peruviana]|uniref:Hydroxyethylthiazole kinase family-domain-containing protein n=1 Tax=Apodospora peruviana TaxID=516989 RepID=A0AAE0M904_9PEZI|nr:Hydroxyethylthiazole kinase family-domain-containing protein [Apodospora peruviana]
MGQYDIDYTLYLVTDSTPEILGNRDFFQVVEAAVKGGVSCVQLRDKKSDTGRLIEIGKRLHQICQRHRVPLLINDRVDVALAVDCEGVHIGQDDMDLALARKLLGPDKVIGVSVSSVDQALEAIDGGADYLGIGTVYATQTKTNTKNIIGPEGVRDILQELESLPKVYTVCIGGINESNVLDVISKSSSPSEHVDGVAVVSAIMAAPDPQAAAQRFITLLGHPSARPGQLAARRATALTPAVVGAVNDLTPLSHNMTNLVVQNFAANVALAVGASPIMSNQGDEAADLCKLKGSLVINMGTVDPDSLGNYVKALQAYNQARQPVVFDPVGAGATTVRRNALRTILGAGYLDVIKGNEGEIRTVFGDNDSHQQRGVDSSSTLSDDQKAMMVRELAQRKKTVIVMTGETDFVSDGTNTFRIDNGHKYLGLVTGSGCVLGTAISAAVAVCPGDKMVATVAAMLHFEIAAELAAARPDVKGPGTFVSAFVDELYNIRQSVAKGELGWLQRAKVQDATPQTSSSSSEQHQQQHQQQC